MALLSLDLTYELASWFCLPGLILDLPCQHAFALWSGLSIAISEPILLGSLEAEGKAMGSAQFLACHPLEKRPGFDVLSSAFVKCVCECTEVRCCAVTVTEGGGSYPLHRSAVTEAIFLPKEEGAVVNCLLFPWKQESSRIYSRR